MLKPFGPYEINDDKNRLDFDALERWLANTYWSPGIGRDEIIKGALHSALVVGCYLQVEQVGYLRLASDKTRFAYIMDVFVSEEHRNRGIAKNMIAFAMEHPEFQDVYQWLLATRDAHLVYRKMGFAPLPNPDIWMVLKKEKKWS